MTTFYKRWSLYKRKVDTKPKRYTDEFKMNIVELNKVGLITPKQLSQECGIGYSKVIKLCQDKKSDKSTGITTDDYEA